MLEVHHLEMGTLFKFNLNSNNEFRKWNASVVSKVGDLSAEHGSSHEKNLRM